MEKLVTVDQLSAMIQFSRRTIYDWIHVGFIPHYKFPKGIRFKISEIEKWLRNRQESGRRRYKTEILV